MQVKFRRKGEIITQWVGDVPKEIVAPEGFEGIDLTGYSVICIRGGKRVPRIYVSEARKNFPNSVIVYDFNYTNGFGSGIDLPENFNCSRLRFYKTEEQLEKEREEAQRAIMIALSQEIVSEIPGIRTHVGYFNDCVEVSPDQEAFCMDWCVKAKDMKEAIDGVSEMMPLWKEWNRRALEVYLHLSGKENPGHGNIQIHPSPTKNDTVGVCYSNNPRRWVYFHKESDGSWVEKNKEEGK
ncbi:MAG: hypothetical protein PHH83_00985 [Patescibacteria group bacterium]|nr:hypothetical protein [Patescibacteria group bacterium]